jgi:uncharacterized protein (DUF2126 family)
MARARGEYHRAYHLARQTRLELKFRSMGGPSGMCGAIASSSAEHPDDSAFLRRPDFPGAPRRLWQNHRRSPTSLRLFIGPTSHIRVDEACTDSYELQIAFDQVTTGAPASI